MTRHITKMLLAASALTVLAAAPAAYAAPAVDTKSHAVKKTAKKVAKTVKVAERSNRARTNRTRTTRQRGVTQSNRGVNSNRRAIRNNVNRSNRGITRSVSRRNLGSSILRTNNRRGFRTNYRSSLGISFHFGTPGYSAYRWAPTAYSLYRPSYGSYGYYQTNTVCRRINVEGWYRGHRELISVKQCSNPWNGSYIVQGSERLVGHY